MNIPGSALPGLYGPYPRAGSGGVMIASQPQLLSIALVERDVVYTPDDVARDVVEFFKPTGQILEPSKGDGAFMRYLPPDTQWCEITEGRDFFAWDKQMDWIIGNPPFSIFSDWLKHSFEIANDIVYIQILSSIFISYKRMKLIYEYGGIKAIYVLGNGSDINMHEFGFNIAAVHFQRNYRGGIAISFRI